MRFLVLALVAALGGQSPPGQPPRDTVRKSTASASIGGRVTDAESGRPLPDAIVSLSPAFPSTLETMRQRLEAATDHDGRYEIAGIQPGEYRVYVSPGDLRGTHLSRPFGAAGAGGSPLAVPVVLAAGERRERVDVALPRALAIEGRVVNEFGEPMADISVRAQMSTGSGGSGRQVQTDDRGLFRVYQLSPGRYRLCATPPERMGPHRPEVKPNDTRYVTACFPSGGPSGPADGVDVASRDAGGIEVQLRPSGAYTLSGHVVNQAGDVARDPQVLVSKVESGGAASGAHAETKDRVFTVRGVTAGEYRIQARTGGGGRPDQGEFGTATVTVEAADVTGVVVATSAGASINGRVEVDGHALPVAASRRLAVVLPELPEDRRAGRVPGGTPKADVADDLTFRLNRVFNRHHVALTGLPDGWVVRSVTFKGADITDRYVMFTSAVERDALRITITDRAAQLNANIVDAKGAVAEGTVLVFPADPARRLGGTRMYGRRRLPSGAFDFGFFAPGDYLVVALPEASLASVFRDRATAFDILAGIAQKVTLGPHEVRTVNVVVTSLPGDR